jgi:hypothetical protein
MVVAIGGLESPPSLDRIVPDAEQFFCGSVALSGEVSAEPIPEADLPKVTDFMLRFLGLIPYQMTAHDFDTALLEL